MRNPLPLRIDLNCLKSWGRGPILLVSKTQVPVTSQAGITADWRAPNVVPALIATFM